MRAAVQRILTLFAIVLAGTWMVWGQATQQPPAQQQNEVPVGPATQPTAQEAQEAAKQSLRPAPLVTAAPVDPNTFEIGPEDILGVRVWKEPELSGGVQVRSDGKITLPLIGEVHAAGKTPEQLRKNIAELLSEYIQNPDVMVSVQSVQSKRFYITGEVGRPGGYQLVVPTTVLQALTNAGGFREFANTKKITIMRNGQLLKFNYKEVIKGKNMQQNIFLQNGDYIIVP